MKKWYQRYQVWILLALIVLLGTGIRLYNLGENSFVADEFLDINSSYGYSQTGTWKAWDFNSGTPASQNINDARDERANVYKWQVAQVFKVLPPTEANARLVSVFWGLISMVLIFFVARYFTKSTAAALLAAFLFALSVSAIIFDRRLRMYAMFLPVYLAFTTSLYALLEQEYRGKLKVIETLWKRYGINILFVIPTLLLGVLSFLTHQITLSIIPVFGVYVLVMAILLWKQGNTKNKYSILVGLGLVGAVAFFIVGGWERIEHLFIFFDDHYSYLGYVFNDFGHPLLGALLVALGAWVLIREKVTQKQGIWLTLSLVVPLALSIWLWHRNAGPQYIFFVQSFTFILTAAGVSALRPKIRLFHQKLDQRKLLIVIALAILLLPNYGYFLEENNTFHETSSGSNPNYRKVFAYFKKNVEPGEVLVTRNFRNYYWSGTNVPVYDFGGELSEKNFQLSELRALQAQYPKGWIIVSDNDLDYISNEVEEEFKKLEKVSNSQVRGDIAIYRWGGEESGKTSK